MRWLSVIVIALLAGSVQCLSACTLEACAQAEQPSPLPPCHQHHQAPASGHLNTCDHQQAVDPSNADALVAPAAFTPAVELPFPFPLAGNGVALLFAATGCASPPKLLAFPVLRI